VVKEDEHPRGRNQGHVADLIVDGLRDGGLAENQYATIYSEEEAITHALEQMRDNDLVVILADDVNKSLNLVRRYSADGVK
jgi:UDP-N-acetylmuramyl tripeptide synthase